MSEIDKLTKQLEKDKKSIQTYYQNNRTNFVINPILYYIKRLFTFSDENYSIETNIIINFFILISYFIGNSCLLKLGYDYLYYPYFLILTMTILIIGMYMIRFKGIIVSLLIYIGSIFWMNNIIYNACIERNYKQEYQEIIFDNNLSEIEFFYYNIQKLNLFKQN